jgi:fatty acid CoA ligase FadD9
LGHDLAPAGAAPLELLTAALIVGALAGMERFRAAVQEAKTGPDKDIPHITAPVIVKHITDLKLLALL